MHQMRFAEADAAVDIKRVEGFGTGVISDIGGRAERHFVAHTLNEILKGERAEKSTGFRQLIEGG